jgi:hypothetical protein
MPPRTPSFALFGIGAVALGVALLQVLAVLQARYVTLAGVVCGVAGAALGLLALGRIAANPRRYAGRPMAIAAVALGLLEAVAYGAYFAVVVLR